MKFLAFIPLLIVFVACNGSKNTQEEPVAQEEKRTPVVEAGEFDALMERIDAELPNMSRIESLIYSREDGSSVSAVAYLDQNDVITKIEEERIDGKTHTSAKYSYYSNGGVLFATKKASEKIKDKTAYFAEEISFYSPDGKVTKSKERTADFEEYISNEEYREVTSIEHSKEDVMKVLRQEGPYTTTFQGFVESGPYHFLIVGENVPTNGYTASLSIQEDSPTLRHLRKEGKNALGKELSIQFEKYVDGQGYIMQILKSIALVERR